MFSIVCPMDTNRFEQFKETKAVYDSFPQKKEFVMPTRFPEEMKKYLKENKLGKDVRLIPYTISGGFNPTKALNIGVRESKYDVLIVTGPEVRPNDDLMDKLEEVKDQNVICQVFDQDEAGNLSSLVCRGYRDQTPQPYFLGMFQKKDIEAINGWDENFMDGYAYEDNDFGARWVRAGLPFTIRDDIQATHLYHPRGETVAGGLDRNRALFEKNNEHGITYCENGLKNGKIQ